MQRSDSKRVLQSCCYSVTKVLHKNKEQLSYIDLIISKLRYFIGKFPTKNFDKQKI